MAVMSQKPELSAFIGALSRTGVANFMQSPGPSTIPAPTNTAIDKVPVSLRADVLGSQPTQDVDPVRRSAVVNAQITDGRHLASEVRGQDRVAMRTRNGNELII